MAVTRAEDLPGLQELWAQTTGIPEVCIAILDGALDICHPCFRGASLQSADPLGRAKVDDAFVRSHGTAVASILFGNHDSSVKGVAPSCRGLIIPIYKVVNQTLSCSQSDLAVAIREAVRLGADIINISGGELSAGGISSSELADAVQYCASKGRLVVAASGNDGCEECLHVPGAIPSVLTVGAMEPDGRPLAQSNWGKAYQSQGIVAPGRDLLVASPGGEYTLATGTSLATPLVSGVAALLAALQRMVVGRSDLRLIRKILLEAATGCDEQPTDECDRLLLGRLNIARAHSHLLSAMKGPPMTDSPQPVLESPVVVPAAEPPIPESIALTTPGVVPAHCGCGGNGGPSQYVYVIGDRIKYDFGSRVRQLSLEANAFTGFDQRSLSEPAVFLRYLLGSTKPDFPRSGNMHEARSVKWVLYQEGCPQYVLEPEGCFCEEVYKALITFFIDTTFNRFGDAPGTSTLFADPPGAEHPGELLRFDCLREYFDCYGGSQVSLVPEQIGAKPGADVKRGADSKHEGRHGAEGRQSSAEGRHAAEEVKYKKFQAEVSSLTGEPLARASKVAIAGRLANKRATLANGQQVEVIYPELRGMSFWSTAALFESLSGGKLKDDPNVFSFAARIVARLYELARNDGKAPQDRAINWAATSLLQNVFSLLEGDFFRQILGETHNADGDLTASAIRDTAVNDIQVRPAACQESGGEYDIELSLFNVENAFRGLTVIANKVDVSDIVPVTLSKNRIFNKRN